MNNILFTGIMPAIITPFDESYNIKKDTVRKLVDWHLSRGVQGFYVCGATGEGPVLPAKTRMEMLETVIDQVKGRGKVIAHVGAPCSQDVELLTKHATEVRADAISSLAPNFFYGYGDDELFNYYKMINDNTDRPLLLYVTPLIRSADLSGLVERMMGLSNVIGAKYTIRDYYQLSLLKMLNGGNINVLNGPDETLISGLMMGADGGIGGTYNIMSADFVEIYSLFHAGRLEEAKELQYRVNKVIEGFGKYGFVTKAILRGMGFDVGDGAFPARKISQDDVKTAMMNLKKLGYDVETGRVMRD